MENKFERRVLVITDELGDLRIDKALATLPEIATRSQAARLIQQGLIRIAGKVLKASYLTQTGDSIDIDIPVVVKHVLLPYEFPLSIVYEDSELLVVDKPSGLVVHPAYGHAQDTLVNALIHYTKDLSMGFNEHRPGLVHRIDKGTSGLLVVAKNEAAQRFLAMQFQAKTTHRLYRAIVFGKLVQPSGTVRSYLKRHPEDRKRVASTPIRDDGTSDGKLAVTHFKLVQYHSTGLSLVELRLETGRTHQIRVHLSENQHPIVGDETYGGKNRVNGIKSVHLRKTIEGLNRFALHAAELGFTHPTTRERMIFKAPWPKDLVPLLEHCHFPRYDESYVIERVEGFVDPGTPAAIADDELTDDGDE
ncbi:MAG: RluA family pseudouridine synthase [Bdellovibrionota bacterium]